MLRPSAYLVAVFAVGCSTTSAPPGTKPIESDGSVVDAVVDAAPVDAPHASDDPCRGTALPVDQHYVAAGLCARLVGKVSGALRQLSFAPNGDLFGVTTAGAIVRLRDANHDGVFDEAPPERVEWANTGGNGNNCHVDDGGGYLYAGTVGGVRRWKWSDAIDAGGAGEDVIVDAPAGGGHGFHTVHVYNDMMYVQVGSEGNATDPMSPEYDTSRSLVKRWALSKFAAGAPLKWADGELVGVGLRNTVGFSRSASGKVYGVMNGMDNIHYKGDDIHQDNPADTLVLLSPGARYGYPFCFSAQRVVASGSVIAPGTQLAVDEFPVHDDAWCATNSTKPLAIFQAHAAPLDIVFFDGALPTGGLPSKFRGGAFVSMHGSWDRAPSTGYKVVFVPFDADERPAMATSTASSTTFPYETVFGGGKAGEPADGAWHWSLGTVSDAPRPVGVAISPIDGALYVSADSSGYVYRIGAVR